MVLSYPFHVKSKRQGLYNVCKTTVLGITIRQHLKYDTRLIGSFREDPGIFPGWHMNKVHWLSVALDGTMDDEKIKFLVDMSYKLTRK
jgi:predicted DNA-binding protein (MmcQ/YjbR family)